MQLQEVTSAVKRRVRDVVFGTDISEAELEHPTLTTMFKVVWQSLRGFKLERAALIVGSAFLLLMIWGFHGDLDLLMQAWPAYRGPGVDIGTRPALIPGIPWDNELISFFGGAILVVLVPILLIKYVYKQPLKAYGLALPPPGRRILAVQAVVILILLSLPAFVLASRDPGMRATYPFYRPFTNVVQFALYELTYLPFFIAIEFIFRGYLLFGLAGIRDDVARTAVRTRGTDVGVPGVFYFGRYALLIQMLSYTAWHLGKPLPELWGTLIWGLVAGVIAYTIRSIWPVVLAHWLLNVIFDAIVLLTL
jgi:hypothetical protein